MQRLYNPRGLFVVPFLGVGPGLLFNDAFAPALVPERPRGFLLVLARGVFAAVASLT